MIQYQKEPSYGIIAGRIFPQGCVWVCNLIVHPKYHRQGYGTAMYLEFEQEAYREDCEDVLIEVYCKNITGKLFWRKMGFEFTGEICDQDYEIWRKQL